ncbi:hypothetical protein [Halorubrum coriense]|uniref:hypothetical protein n=1 Tax=Halorubrum coriense TaxID=64713 RepID=UPI0012692ACE|nr:hypothetical protein [Halorubrum coriense]
MGELSNWRRKRILRKYHIEKGWSAREIAEEADVSPALVTDYLKNRDLLRPSSTSSSGGKQGGEKEGRKEPKQETHTCPDCGEEFDSVDEWSDHHQFEHYSWEIYERQRIE